MIWRRSKRSGIGGGAGLGAGEDGRGCVERDGRRMVC
jgi:hypothetical protein